MKPVHMCVCVCVCFKIREMLLRNITMITLYIYKIYITILEFFTFMAENHLHILVNNEIPKCLLC